MGPFLHTSGLGRYQIPPAVLFCVQNVDSGRQYYFGDWLFEVTRWNGEEGYAEIKDGGVMIFNQFTLIA